MTAMKVRPKVTDLLLVAGVAVLLVWTPAYLAQGEEQRSLLDGEEFWLPEFRDGDRVDMELIVTWPNGTSYSSGPILTLEYELPPADADPGIMMVERRTYHRTHMDFAGASVQQDHLVRSGHLTAELDDRWGTLDTYVPLERGSFAGDRFEQDVRVQRSGHGFISNSVWYHRDEPYRFERATALQSLADYFVQVAERRPEPPPPSDPLHTPPVAAEPVAFQQNPNQYKVHAVYDHRGQHLYAAALEEGVWTHRTNGTHDQIQMGDAPAIPLGLNPPIPRDGGYRDWLWYARDFPTKVGVHEELIDTLGRPYVTADLVPYSIERGEKPIPLAPEPEYRMPDTIPLRDWMYDEGTILANVSASALRRSLADPSTPSEISGFLEKGAWFGGLAWVGERVSQPDGRGWWIVLLVDDEGTTKVISLLTLKDGTLVSPPEGSILCGSNTTSDSYSITAECNRVHLDPYGGWRFAAAGDGDSLLSPPSEIAAILQDNLSDVSAGRVLDATDALLWMIPGLAGKEPIPPPGYGDRPVYPLEISGPGLPRFALAFEGRFARAFVQDESASWHATVSYASKFLDIRGENDFTVPSEAFAKAQPRVMATEASPLRPLDFLDAKAAYGGLALLLLGVLARVFSGLSGAPLPIGAALYAKIAKDRSLGSERRQALLAAIQEDEGIALNDLARRVGLHRTVAFHHLDTLRRNRVVKEIRLGRTRHYVTAGRGEREGVRLAATHHDAWRLVLDAVDEEPGATLAAIARRIGRDRSRVVRVSGRLERLGLVQRSRDAEGLRVYPVEREARPQGTSTEAAPVPLPST